MKKTIILTIIILIMIPFFLIQQKSSKNILIVLYGESNSGGIAPNSSATTQEIAPRNIKILNNNTLQFEPLDIGTNNLIGHIGLESYASNSHGMELEIANKYDEGYFNGKTVYIVKAGKGGSKTSEWGVGSTAYNNLTTRVNAAKTLIGNCDIIFMLSIGINDSLANTDATTYKTQLKDLVERTKADFSPINFDLRMMKFEFVPVTPMTNYQNKIIEVKNEVSGVSTFNTSGCGVLSDGWHLNYSGMKTATDNFLNKL